MDFCGAPQINTQQSASDMFSALYNYYPLISKVYQDQLLPTANAELGAAQGVSPAYQKLMTDLYAQYGPENAKIGQQIDNSNRVNAANTDVSILQNQGKQLGEAYKSIDQELNPEFYDVRSRGASSIDQLLGSINLDNANPEAERLVGQEAARTGNLATPSATGTVSNALSFGNELNKRRSALSQAISAATNFLQPSSTATNFNPATAELNKPTSNTGATAFSGVKQDASASANTAANNFTNSLTQLQAGYNNNMANRRDVVDRINEGFSSL